MVYNLIKKFNNSNINLFMFKNKLENDVFILNKNIIGGSSYKTTIKNEEYIIKYYINKLEDKNIITIEAQDKSDCVMMFYKDKTELYINDFLSYKTCCSTKSNITCNGENLLKIVINFAKDNKFNKIILDDKSIFYCDMFLSYQLLYGNTLTCGCSWYYKNGFRFINPNDNERTKKNIIKLSSIKIKNINLDGLIKLIKNIEVIELIKNLDIDYINNAIEDIILYCSNNLEVNICILFDYIKKKYCNIFCCIYLDIYDSLKLFKYKTNLMVYNIR